MNTEGHMFRKAPKSKAEIPRRDPSIHAKKAIIRWQKAGMAAPISWKIPEIGDKKYEKKNLDSI